MTKKIQSALISVYYKDGLDKIVQLLHEHNVQIFSTGGTQQFVEDLGIPVTAVEDLTSYPSIFGGRVKTLHPKIFGGILYRRDNEGDVQTAAQFEIPSIDLVIVDLYPFVETVASGASDEDIIEKIDIGGISLIRGAAKNFNDVLIVSSREQYDDVYEILKEKDCSTDLSDRRRYAKEGFLMSSSYDTAIHNYFSPPAPRGGVDGGFIPPIGEFTDSIENFSFESIKQYTPFRGQGILRYGENPHQAATFYGDLDAMFEQIHGKELSYNNLMDVESCVRLMDEFTETSFVIVKRLWRGNCSNGTPSLRKCFGLRPSFGFWWCYHHKCQRRFGNCRRVAQTFL
jgi:phosphoribosylaminoimidazolecarboxamide formyltransferase / IMP cyclohydrolase